MTRPDARPRGGQGRAARLVQLRSGTFATCSSGALHRRGFAVPARGGRRRPAAPGWISTLARVPTSTRSPPPWPPGVGLRRRDEQARRLDPSPLALRYIVRIGRAGREPAADRAFIRFALAFRVRPARSPRSGRGRGDPARARFALDFGLAAGAGIRPAWSPARPDPCRGRPRRRRGSTAAAQFASAWHTGRDKERDEGGQDAAAAGEQAVARLTRSSAPGPQRGRRRLDRPEGRGPDEPPPADYSYDDRCASTARQAQASATASTGRRRAGAARRRGFRRGRHARAGPPSASPWPSLARRRGAPDRRDDKVAVCRRQPLSETATRGSTPPHRSLPVASARYRPSSAPRPPPPLYWPNGRCPTNCVTTPRRRGLLRRAGLRAMGRQGPALRRRVGARGAQHGRAHLSVGQRARARGGEHRRAWATR